MRAAVAQVVTAADAWERGEAGAGVSLRAAVTVWHGIWQGVAITMLMEHRRITPEGCWEWTGPTAGDGYGYVRLPRPLMLPRGIPASRLAAELWLAPPASRRLWALHSCDNRLCFNPAHLRWGTPQHNADDRVERERQTRGEGFSHSKLNDDLVREIRDSSVSGSEWARRVGISPTVVNKARRKSTWRHVR